MRKYSQEFKDSTIQLVLNSNEATKKIAEKLGVYEKTLYAWVRAYKVANNIEISSIDYTKNRYLLQKLDIGRLAVINNINQTKETSTS